MPGANGTHVILCTCDIVLALWQDSHCNLWINRDKQIVPDFMECTLPISSCSLSAFRLNRSRTFPIFPPGVARIRPMGSLQQLQKQTLVSDQMFLFRHWVTHNWVVGNLVLFRVIIIPIIHLYIGQYNYIEQMPGTTVHYLNFYDLFPYAPSATAANLATNPFTLHFICRKV